MRRAWTELRGSLDGGAGGLSDLLVVKVSFALPDTASMTRFFATFETACTKELTTAATSSDTMFETSSRCS